MLAPSSRVASNHEPSLCSNRQPVLQENHDAVERLVRQLDVCINVGVSGVGEGVLDEVVVVVVLLAELQIFRSIVKPRSVLASLMIMRSGRIVGSTVSTAISGTRRSVRHRQLQPRFIAERSFQSGGEELAGPTHAGAYMDNPLRVVRPISSVTLVAPIQKRLRGLHICEGIKPRPAHPSCCWRTNPHSSHSLPISEYQL